MKNERNFMKLLLDRWALGFFVCIGLDSDHGKIPMSIQGESTGDRIFLFNKAIIDATWRNALAFKLNLAFYLWHGDDGIEALVRTVNYIRIVAPDVPVILDSKSGDIDNTNIGYVEYVFNLCKADAITVHNYMGRVAMLPFLEQKNKGVIVLCKTSNNGSGEFQDLIIKPENEGGLEEPLYCRVARNVAEEWNFNGNCALVVGATYPEQLARVRAIVGKMPILLPGIGAQGGDVRKSVRAGIDMNRQGIIVNSSRGIIFKSADEDFAEVALREVVILNDMINEHRLDDKLTSEEVLELLERVKAVLTGDHFVFTSGLHGNTYINKDGAYPYVEDISKLCRAMAATCLQLNIEVIVGPEKGGIILAQWTAYHLGRMTGKIIPAVYAEKEDESFVFRRQYGNFVKGKRTLVVEDILNTGGSVEKVINLVRSSAGIYVAGRALVNRGTSQIEHMEALANVSMTAVSEDQCQECANGTPVNLQVGKGKEYMAKKASEGK